MWPAEAFRTRDVHAYLYPSEDKPLQPTLELSILASCKPYCLSSRDTKTQGACVLKKQGLSIGPEWRLAEVQMRNKSGDNEISGCWRADRCGI